MIRDERTFHNAFSKTGIKQPMRLDETKRYLSKDLNQIEEKTTYNNTDSTATLPDLNLSGARDVLGARRSGQKERELTVVAPSCYQGWPQSGLLQASLHSLRAQASSFCCCYSQLSRRLPSG